MIRIAIPFAAILAGLAAFAARSSGQGSQTVHSSALPTPPRSTESEIPRPLIASEPSSPSLSSEAAVFGIGTPLGQQTAKPLPEPHVQNRLGMMALLERELSLSLDQRRYVEEVLVRRQEAIDRHHAQLRATGAVSGQAYHRHMQELRAQSYVQIGQVLDSKQHRRFLIIIANGALNDVIGFPMDEGMVALD